ncbi:MAG: hypothetical protein ACO2YZ_08680 [Litorivicinaceae bacterium]
MQRLIALVGLLLPLVVQAAGSQTLESPTAVLDALKQSRGGVLLAFIDQPSDQANPVKHLQGLLSRYRLDLNGTDLGQVRRNTILHVRPRLGVNRLTIENTFDDQQRKQLSFPAMRAAGVPTAIVEIRTSRDFAWMEALTLSAAEVQAVENALDRNVSSIGINPLSRSGSHPTASTIEELESRDVFRWWLGLWLGFRWFGIVSSICSIFTL